MEEGGKNSGTIINPNKFNSLIKKYLGICRIHNYYGMIDKQDQF